MAAPHVDVLLDIDRRAVRQRQGIEVGDLDPFRGAYHAPGAVTEGDAAHRVQRVGALHGDGVQQLIERQLALADDDGVGAGGEVFLAVVGALGTAEDDRPAAGAGGGHDLQHRTARHEIGVDAEHAAGLLLQLRDQRRAFREGAVENLDAVAAGFQVGADVEQPERRVRLHDLLLLLVLREEVAVRQQDLSHECSAPRRRHPSARATRKWLSLDCSAAQRRARRRLAWW